MEGLRVTYLGQCGFLLESQGVRIVTDPYLSDYVDRNNEGWARSYAPPRTLSELKPDMILISHSHDDHMDPQTLGEYRKSGGNAPVAAPAPEVGLLKTLGFSKVIEARAEKEIRLRDITITPIACAHTSLDMDEQGRFRYLSYLIDFGDHCVFFGGDMSLYDGLAERVLLENCDLLLLPCNGRDEERTAAGIIGNTTAEEAAQFAATLGVPFIPAHHDLYANNGRPVPEILRAAEDAGAQIRVLGPGESVSLDDEDEDDEE
ncbi:MAG: MBL fold metallo-hydrolase [Eubacteriales bacterium]|nr:MBL fold metallo-hydrolase [Eubacteriales bacterium]